MHFSTCVVYVFDLFHTQLFHLLLHSSVPTCPVRCAGFPGVSAEWGVCVLWAGWALQRTQHAKEMKTVPITQNFCSPRVIHSVCQSPLGVPHYAPERKASISFHTTAWRVRVCSSADSPRTSETPVHLCARESWQASGSVGSPLLLDCSQLF